jgi:nucleoside phosphorylase
MRAGILILSAHPPELSGLRPILGDHLRGTVGGRQVATRAIGIGLVAAASGATAAFQSFEPEAVILVGTSGAYAGRGIALGEVVTGRRICLVSTAVAESRGAFPPPMQTAVEASGPLSGALSDLGARPVSVATTLAITTDDALAARAAAHRDCDVEHLEAYAVAEVCAARAISFGVVLGVANVVGARAREQWQQNHRAAGDAAGALVGRWLELGAPGVGGGAKT